MKIVQENLPDALENCIIKTYINKLFGTIYNGYYLPENIKDYLNKNSIIYLFGVGECVILDILLSGLLDVPVYLFDPTPRAIEHIKVVKEVIDTKNTPEYNLRCGGGDLKYWNKILSYNAKSKNIHMNNYGVFTEDRTCKFYKPENSEYVSHSLIDGNASDEFIEVPVKKMTTIMNELGHTRIDFIKLDIEGAECDVMYQIFRDKIYPKFICIKFSIAKNKKIDGMAIANRCLNMIVNQGYDILKCDKLEYSFIKRTIT